MFSFSYDVITSYKVIKPNSKYNGLEISEQRVTRLV